MRKIARFFVWLGGVVATASIITAGVVAGRSATRHEIGSAKQTNSGAGTRSEQNGFYCNLKALGATERLRHLERTMKLTSARAETKELADGYAFRFSSDAVSVAELGEWVMTERKCCPFFDFEIEAEQDGGPVWLKLRGREGVKPFIRSEFGAGR